MRLVVRGPLLMFHEHKGRVRGRRDRQLPANWFRCPEDEAETQASVVLDLGANGFQVVPVRIRIARALHLPWFSPTQ
jgi:hypothetical protein